jgi:hypothetical protein
MPTNGVFYNQTKGLTITTNSINRVFVQTGGTTTFTGITSGNTIVEVQGVSGQVMKVTDCTNGVLFSSNNFTGAPIFQTNSCGSIIGGIGSSSSANSTTIGGGCNNSTTANFSTVGGGQGNCVSGFNSTIGGGCSNTVSNCYSTIGGGRCNVVSNCCSTIGGGNYNILSGRRSTISGGIFNTISSESSTIGGGIFNTISSENSTIGGGISNTISSENSTIGGGSNNTTTGNVSTIGGGSTNTASGNVSTIGGGCNNTTTGGYSTISGGQVNLNKSSSGVIGGGTLNAVACTTIFNGINASGGYICLAGDQTSNFTAGDTFISANGQYNSSRSGSIVSSYYSGGYTTLNTSTDFGSYTDFNIINTTTATNAENFSTIGGGFGNIVSGKNSTIGGGYKNTSSNNYSTVGGGKCNMSSGSYSTVGGGLSNSSGPLSTIGGGCGNVSLWFSTIGGGRGNSASDYSTIGGGQYNTMSTYNNSHIVIGGGKSNTTGNFVSCSSILGGYLNNMQCSSNFSSILGGKSNCLTNGANYSSIIGGCSNCIAGGCNVFILGSNITATAADYTFVNNLCSFGQVNKAGGTFKISHPDPKKTDTHYLLHSFVESPTAGDNIYRYEVESIDGVVEIELPDYFNYLNENIQVWVNGKNNFGIGYGNVNEELTKITINTSIDGKYNVLVIGTRKDNHAKKHWKGVETLKEKINK